MSFDAWKLEVGGLVDIPFRLAWEQFLALPQVDDVSDFHCVATWSRFDNHWRGVPVRGIAGRAVPHENARFVLCAGSAFAPRTYIPHTGNVPRNRPVDHDALPADTWEVKPLAREDGDP